MNRYEEEDAHLDDIVADVYHRIAVDAVNFYVAFDDADASNGGLEVAHGTGTLRGSVLTSPTERPMDDALAASFDLGFFPQTMSWHCVCLITR